MESDVREAQEMNQLIQLELSRIEVDPATMFELDEACYMSAAAIAWQDMTQDFLQQDDVNGNDEDNAEEDGFKSYLKCVQDRIQERANIVNFVELEDDPPIPVPKIAFGVPDEVETASTGYSGASDKAGRLDVALTRELPPLSPQPEPLAQPLEPYTTNSGHSSQLQSRLLHLQKLQEKQQAEIHSSSAIVLQAHLRGWLWRKHNQETLQQIRDRARASVQQRKRAAILIQCTWRGVQIRRLHRHAIQLASLRAGNKTRFLQSLREEGSHGLLACCQGYLVRQRYKDQLVICRQRAQQHYQEQLARQEAEQREQAVALARQQAALAEARRLEEQRQREEAERARLEAQRIVQEEARQRELLLQEQAQIRQAEAEAKARNAEMAQEAEIRDLQRLIEVDHELRAHLTQWEEWAEAELAKAPSVWKVFEQDCIEQGRQFACVTLDTYASAAIPGCIRVFHVGTCTVLPVETLFSAVSLRAAVTDRFGIPKAPIPAVSLCLRSSASDPQELSIDAPLLRYLDLSRTPLACLRLKSTMLLTTLSLANCGLSALPDISAALALTTLNAASNQVEHIKISHLSCCPRLQRCDLTGNPIRIVETDASLPVMLRLTLSQLPDECKVDGITSSKSGKGIVLSRRQLLPTTHPLWSKAQAGCRAGMAALIRLSQLSPDDTNREVSNAIQEVLQETFGPVRSTSIVVASPPERRGHQAAVRIQATWRGYYLRSRLNEVLARAMGEQEIDEDDGMMAELLQHDMDDDFKQAPRLPPPQSWTKPAHPQSYPLRPLSRPATASRPSSSASIASSKSSSRRATHAQGCINTTQAGASQLGAHRPSPPASRQNTSEIENEEGTTGWGSKTTQALFKARQRTMSKRRRQRLRR
eukprot:TRINITY_DN5373_c0_g1_i1.p1 TRINITY_DN5373_c0_g1~~TRINITY_DN5373_c0_g1_i1.p1  ORF type:complete len:876 (+),score=154.57 TRINITY_DN5373_c0_g1_i1:152-2779(+)